MMIGAGHWWIMLIWLLIIAAITIGIVAMVRRSGRADTFSMVGGRRECPACKEWMRRDASVCPHCRTASEPWTFHDGRWWVVRANASYYLDEPSQTWRQVEPPPPPS